MGDISELRKMFGSLLESMISARQVQLAPLVTGDMHIAYRTGVLGSEWVDVTDTHALKLRTEIADMQGIADLLGEDCV